MMNTLDHHPPHQRVPGGKCSGAVRGSILDCRANQMAKTPLAMLVLLSAAAAQIMMAMAAGPEGMSDSGFCSQIIEPYILYNCTEYTVTTFDGYLLSLQLIQPKESFGNISRGHVLFLHSSIVGGSSWFRATTPTPFAVVDAGYSAWIGNARTSEFTFGHNRLNASEQEYWNWDMDELANYDFPSFVDFVYAATNGSKFHFVGYSQIRALRTALLLTFLWLPHFPSDLSPQGARVGLGAISYQWNRAAMIASATLLAPVVYMTNTMSRVLLALNYTDMAELGYHLGVGKFCFSSLLGLTPPLDSQELHNLEGEFLCQLTGPNCCVDQHVAYTALMGPHSTTTYKNLAHLTQSMRSQTFMAYDFGSVNLNTVVYQSTIPPKYKLGQVPSSVSIFVLYGGNDRLSTAEDIEYMISQLPTQPQVLFNPSYAHLDYLLSTAMMQDVNMPILNFIGQHN